MGTTCGTSRCRAFKVLESSGSPDVQRSSFQRRRRAVLLPFWRWRGGVVESKWLAVGHRDRFWDGARGVCRKGFSMIGGLSVLMHKQVTSVQNELRSFI